MLDFSQAISTIQQSNNILILPSAPADGDSISSALALYMVLRSQGRTPTVVLSSDVPDVYKFLPESAVITKDADLNPEFVITVDLRDAQVNDVKHEIVDNKVNIVITPERGQLSAENVSFPESNSKYDLLITVDCASLDQLGDFYTNYANVFGQIPSINFDHHHSNAQFGSINLVDHNSSSTTQILVELFKQMNVQMTPDLATLLLAGIITDTGSFQNPNTTPESFDIAANLVDQGARQQEIIKHVYKTKQLETLRLWGRILSSINIDEASKLMWVNVSRAVFEETGTTEEDVGDIIDELLANAQEAEVVLLLVEKADGSLHGSIRTTTDERDGVQIAALYGGGGHTRAAGFTIQNATIAQKEQEIIQSILNIGSPVASTAPDEPVAPVEPAPEPVQPVVEETPAPQPEPVVEAPVEAPQPDIIIETPAEPVTPVEPMIEPVQPVVEEIPGPEVPVTPEPEGKVELVEQETGIVSGTPDFLKPETVVPEPSATTEPAPETPVEQVDEATLENPEERIDSLARNFASGGPAQPVNQPEEEVQPPTGPPAPLI